MVRITNCQFIQRAINYRVCAILALIATAAWPIASLGDNQNSRSDTKIYSSSRHQGHNVILFIGDGMDQHQITMARNYLYPAGHSFSMEQMPVRTSVRIHTLREDSPNQFRFVADSANTATTLATGILTSKGRVSTSANTDLDLPTLLEMAQQHRYRTGLVSTASLTDPTPAAFASHVAHRYCQSPIDMHVTNPLLAQTQQCAADLKENGGPGSIAEQLASANIDVLLGGGMGFFNQLTDVKKSNTSTIVEQAQDRGYQILSTSDELENAPDNRPLLGLFAKKHLPVEWRGQDNQRAEKITTDRSGNTIYPEPFSCETNPLHNNTPTLAQMTATALGALSEKNSTGFFLMVEGASIDKQAHERNPCGQIGELRAFDEAVTIGREFAAQHPETLIIVTADHGHSGQIIPLPESYQAASKFVKMPQYTKGYYALLKTLPGELMAIHYATNSSPKGLWEMHTGTDVPAFMEGPGLENVPALIDQRDIHQLMREHLGLSH